MSPGFPGSLPGYPELFQIVLVSKRVHRLPESEVSIDRQFLPVRESLKWASFPHCAVIGDQINHLWLKHKESAVDPSRVFLGLLLKPNDARVFYLQCPVPAWRLHACQRGQSPMFTV